ncbi:MAG: ribosome small subunit-dependent GTPase A [Candidatus Latescibacterota bacterium]|jgi:ribosome biogenesis GTPase
MQANLKEALVVRVTGSDVRVVTEDGEGVSCALRGRLRRKDKDVRVAAGDRVRVMPPRQAGDAWTLQSLEPRSSRLSRYVERDASERIIVANVDRLYVVASLRAPPIHYDFVDRVLVSAHWGGVGASVVLNKTDLAGRDEIDAFVALYRSCGYEVLETSVLTGEGMEDLTAVLGAGVYAFVGASGVGKSSLVMSVDPSLNLKVGDIGGKTGRGRHTTTFSQLYPFGKGYLADTPGIQTFGYPGSEPLELSRCFPEFETYAQECRFHRCTHSHEPDCGVKRAVEAGDIYETRHTSYLNILAEVEARDKHPGR